MEIRNYEGGGTIPGQCKLIYISTSNLINLQKSYKMQMYAEKFSDRFFTRE